MHDGIVHLLYLLDIYFE